MIHGFAGPMFSGKSTALINQLKRAEIAGKRVVCFKPSIDTRYHENSDLTVTLLKKLAAHSQETRPGFVYGLALSHEPVLGTWLDDAVAAEHAVQDLLPKLAPAMNVDDELR